MPVFVRREQWRALVDLVRVADVEGLARFLRETDAWLNTGSSPTGDLWEALRAAPGRKAELLDGLIRHGMNPVGTRLEAHERFTVQAALQGAPTWRRDAFEQDIKGVSIVRAKAWGMSFVPGDGHAPVRYGGDYDGAYPVSAEAALRDFDTDVRKSQIAPAAKWFRPFLQRMAKGKDFPLGDVIELITDPRSVSRA